MAENRLNARIILKSDTSANWAKATGFAPLKGEVVIYTDLNRFKIGDGTTNVNDLPFAEALGTLTASDDGAGNVNVFME